MSETREVRGPEDEARLDRFYEQLYLPAFVHQREPLEVWKRQLWGAAAPYELSIVLAGDEGGIVSELYPASACGFLTYLVVAPGARRAGLGRRLLDGARGALAARAEARGIALRAVFGEVADPARLDGEAGAAARERLARFGRWGARVVDVPYVQPSLGPGLARDPGLRLIAFFDGTPPATLPGSVVADFVRELYTVTEGAPVELAVSAEVGLRNPDAAGVSTGR